MAATGSCLQLRVIYFLSTTKIYIVLEFVLYLFITLMNKLFIFLPSINYHSSAHHCFLSPAVLSEIGKEIGHKHCNPMLWSPSTLAVCCSAESNVASVSTEGHRAQRRPLTSARLGSNRFLCRRKLMKTDFEQTPLRP